LKSKSPSPKRQTVPRTKDSTRCLFAFADGRQCCMPRSATHPALCFHHAREERQLRDADLVGVELASLSGDFKTANDLNHVLGKLFTLIAQGRIPARNAALLAYVGQLLLHSLDSVKREICRVQGTDAWEHLLLRAFTPRLPAPQPLVSREARLGEHTPHASNGSAGNYGSSV